MAPTKFERSPNKARTKKKSWFSAPKVALAALVIAPACGGTGGCSSCGGVTPLPGGFVNEERIENAAALRLTESGLDFMEANLGSIASNLLGNMGQQGVVTFPVPESTGGFDVILTTIDYTVCPGGPDAAGNPPKCLAEIDLANADLAIQPENPHNITISGTVPLRLQYLPFDSDIGGMDIVLNGNDSCPGENQTFAPIGVTIKLSVETDTDPTHARLGYSRIKIASIDISQSDIENNLKLNCSGFLGTIADLLKGLLVGQLMSGLTGTLNTTVEEQLCQKANPDVSPSCPTGTNDVEGVCRYGTAADSECVSMVLGTDGHANLAGLLAGISPGTKGGMDFLLAAGGQSQRDDGSGYTWGDLNPINNGATLGMMGGVEPNPLSKCVPLSTLARPSGLKIPTELLDNTVTGWPANVPGPHLGIGISESFFNYALSGMYNSGLLCIGLSTESIDLLNSGTLGLLAQSLKDLGIQRETQPIAIVLTPTQPPHVTFGNGTNLDTDPLIKLDLKGAGFDFYTFSSDRYIRFMTAKFDISAPINLTVTPEGLVPVLDKLAIENGTVTNSSLLKEDPATIAASLQGLLASQVGTLLGSGLPAVDLNSAVSSLGMRLVIPETVEGQGSPGLRTLTKDNERYLGIFAALELAAPNQNAMETSLSLVGSDVDPAGLRMGTITPDNGPEITVLAEVANDGGQTIERQYRVDGGLWHPFTKDRYLHIADEGLRLEGKHAIEVRSRIEGQPYTLDVEPASMEFIVDATPPEAIISNVTEAEQVSISTYELVSRDATKVRYRFDGAAFSAWMPADQLKLLDVPEGAESLVVEAIDENGNVGTATSELIRGLPRGDGGGCGCAVVGGTSDELPRWPFALVGMGILGLFARRRGSSKAAAKGNSAKRQAPGSLGSVLLKSRTSQVLGAGMVVAVGGSFSGCSCDDETDPNSNYKCEAPACAALEPALIGAYTSVGVDSKGTIWVSGYNEANYESAFPNYGDLAVGKVNGDKVEWTLVDGVPLEPKPDGKTTDLKGFRGGQTAPGDDVGIWTSLAINPATDQPAVVYYDRTNKGLKYAEYNGKAWEVSVIDDSPTSDTGRYAKLVFDGDTAVVAFQSIESSDSGMLVSKVRLGRGAAKGGFIFEDVAVNEATPCRSGFCTGGTQCVADDGVCAAAGASCADCAMGESCVKVANQDVCKTLLTTAKIEPYPVATGDYVALAKIPTGGVGLAYYDRVNGTVNVAAKGGAGWENVVVDGGVAADGTQNDVGVGTSLAIDDDGTWHVAYVDGYNESLKYAEVVDGAVKSIETVDNGLEVGGVANADGQHVIGDDSFIYVTPQGDIQISYQDATAGKLRIATGTPNATGHDWNQKVVDGDAFGGFFSRLIEIDGALKVVSWWRKIELADDGTKRGVGDVSIAAP